MLPRSFAALTAIVQECDRATAAMLSEHLDVCPRFVRFTQNRALLAPARRLRPLRGHTVMPCSSAASFDIAYQRGGGRCTVVVSVGFKFAMRSMDCISRAVITFGCGNATVERCQRRPAALGGERRHRTVRDTHIKHAKLLLQDIYGHSRPREQCCRNSRHEDTARRGFRTT